MKIKEALLSQVRQINQVLNQLEPIEYRSALPEYEGSTLGQHFRHILEFFQCLEKGIPGRRVDYGSRERNLLYEDNPALAAGAFETFIDALELVDPEMRIDVVAELGSNARPAYASTVGRELLFVYDHAIHHLAIIKIGLLCRFPHVQTKKDMGVSPSTVQARLAS
jgi:hypothetical protein